MTLDELKVEAKKILAIEPPDGFEHKTFVTGSGGDIRNDAGVTEVHRSCDYAYNTTGNGPAYCGSVTIACRDTGTTDADGYPIYAACDGKVFVYRYYRGSAEYFDSGRLAVPKLY